MKRTQRVGHPEPPESTHASQSSYTSLRTIHDIKHLTMSTYLSSGRTLSTSSATCVPLCVQRNPSAPVSAETCQLSTEALESVLVACVSTVHTQRSRITQSIWCHWPAPGHIPVSRSRRVAKNLCDPFTRSRGRSYDNEVSIARRQRPPTPRW